MTQDFIPAYPVALNIFSFVNPCLFHSIYCIVIMGVRIKAKRWLRITQISTIMETCIEELNLSEM